jgi:hypothetical protein
MEYATQGEHAFLTKERTSIAKIRLIALRAGRKVHSVGKESVLRMSRRLDSFVRILTSLIAVGEFVRDATRHLSFTRTAPAEHIFARETLAGYRWMAPVVCAT